MGETFAIMLDDGAARLVFFPMVDEFDGPPMGNVPVFTMSEDTIQHSGCCQQTDMTSVQRREGPPGEVVGLANEHAAGLPVSGRLQQQIFHLVERNSTVSKDNWPGRRNRENSIGRISERRNVRFGRGPCQISCRLK